MARSRPTRRSKPRRTSTGAFPLLVCEGLVLAIADRGQAPREALLEAKRALRETFGAKSAWRVTPLGQTVKEYLAAPPRPPHVLPLKTAWDQARRLSAHPLVTDAEPALRGPGIVPADPRAALASGERARFGRRMPSPAKAFFGTAALSCSTASDWSLDTARVKPAWDAFPARGEGIRVGHPDTGYTHHDEIWSDDPARNRILEGFDFVEGEPDPLDDLEGGLLEFPGHGTATASVIMSDVGGPFSQFVRGVAPQALLAPLRVSRSVIHLSYGNLIQALDFAREHDHHVVSMSLGGPLPSGALERAVGRATRAGLILVAAAGNYWPSVTYPGALDDIVTVAACNCVDGVWAFTSAGSEVDVAAPGESVWVARSVHDGTPPFRVEQGSGSSFGTAMVAGIAALWLSHHGRDALIARYGRPGVPRVFRHLLVNSGVRTPPGWDISQHGAGIVDAERLLGAPLPAAAPAPPARAVAATTSTRVVAAIRHAVPSVDEAVLRPALARLLHIPEPNLDATLAEVGGELAVHASIDPGLREALRAASRPMPEAGAKRRPRARAGARPSPQLERTASARLLGLMRPR